MRLDQDMKCPELSGGPFCRSSKRRQPIFQQLYKSQLFKKMKNYHLLLLPVGQFNTCNLAHVHLSQMKRVLGKQAGCISEDHETLLRHPIPEVHGVVVGKMVKRWSGEKRNVFGVMKWQINIKTLWAAYKDIGFSRRITES